MPPKITKAEFLELFEEYREFFEALHEELPLVPVEAYLVRLRLYEDCCDLLEVKASFRNKDAFYEAIGAFHHEPTA